MYMKKRIWISAFGVFALTAACIGSAAPVTPTASINDISTIVAATMQVLTPVPSPTITSQPTAVPSTIPTIPPPSSGVSLPSATRVKFLTGATTAQVSAPIQSGQSIFYVLKALQGQPMIATVDSIKHDVTLSIQTQGGTYLLSPAAGKTTWEGLLPQTEDYYIGIYGGASTENFNLSVEIPSRIQFEHGKDSAIVTGSTAAGYIVDYVLFATQGQKMTVHLNGVGHDGALSIYGFSDGQPYIRSVVEQIEYSFKLPRTQDYIIQVVPRAGKVIHYTLVVEVK